MEDYLPPETHIFSLAPAVTDNYAPRNHIQLYSHPTKNASGQPMQEYLVCLKQFLSLGIATGVSLLALVHKKVDPLDTMALSAFREMR